MKYILAKDLPFAESNEIIAKENEIAYAKSKYTVDLIMLGSVKDLILSGWIKEVKPREFYVNEQALMNLDKQLDYVPKIKYIKVREVIDD